MAYISFQPKDYFNTKLYTGTGSSNVLTGIGFQSDLIWTTTRNASEIRPINDSVNGINGYVRSNDVDMLDASGSCITAQSSDGYTVGTEDRFNENLNTFVSWNWKAGTSTGIDLTAGTITPSAYSISTTAGISILKYAGTGTASQTIAHGLGSVPKFMLFKRTDASGSWPVYNASLGPTKAMILNTTAISDTGTSYFQDTDPTSTLISIGSAGELNASSSTNICYCFAEKQGYSKFGMYTGNGNADGSFIYTGFRPAYFLIKADKVGEPWLSFNNKTQGFNADGSASTGNHSFNIESTLIESNSSYIDFVSNGIKLRNGGGHIGGAWDYIYAAFAESPIVSSNNIPVVAR